jgi:HPt (histidine-containing phosphotransfer) domain-containing protein
MEMLQCNLDKIKNITPGNNAFPTQIITLFLSDTPKSIENAKKALEQNDFQQVYANIHKIKPSIIMVGVPDGTLQLVLSINENTKKNTNLELIPEKLKQLELDLNGIYEFLQQELMLLQN